MNYPFKDRKWKNRNGTEILEYLLPQYPFEKGNPKSNFIKLSSTEHGCSKPIRIGRVPFH